MKEHVPQLAPDELNSLFAQLNPLDVEQFYTAYQLWSTRQRIQTLQALMDAIQRDIVENTECLEQVHPSALALATLARLQAQGVSDITVLDNMLERGEEWLDRTMQRLEYCENIDVISGDYTKWCEHALEGAYDWIDSIQGPEADDFTPGALPSSASAIMVDDVAIESEEIPEHSESANEMMEELFLQKLMSDDTATVEAVEATETRDDTVNAEDEASIPTVLATTLKIQVIAQPATPATPPDAAHADNVSNTLPAQSELPILPTEQETRPEEVESTPVLAESLVEHVDVLLLTRTPIITCGNAADQVAALPRTVAPTRRKRGIVRTLIAVLFHV